MRRIQGRFGPEISERACSRRSSRPSKRHAAAAGAGNGHCCNSENADAEKPETRRHDGATRGRWPEVAVAAGRRDARRARAGLAAWPGRGGWAYGHDAGAECWRAGRWTLACMRPEGAGASLQCISDCTIAVLHAATQRGRTQGVASAQTRRLTRTPVRPSAKRSSAPARVGAVLVSGSRRPCSHEAAAHRAAYGRQYDEVCSLEQREVPRQARQAPRYRTAGHRSSPWSQRRPVRPCSASSARALEVAMSQPETAVPGAWGKGGESSWSSWPTGD